MDRVLHSATGLTDKTAHPVPAHVSRHTTQRGGVADSKIKPRQRSRRKVAEEADDPTKRRCISTACIACRKRKSKCDGNIPACAACSKVYGTECIYDPNSDLRRRGVYRHGADTIQPKESTLHTLIQAILNSPDEDVSSLVQEIRTCESLDAIAERISSTDPGAHPSEEEDNSPQTESSVSEPSTFEAQLSGKIGNLRLDDGSMRHIGGTSNLIHLAHDVFTVGQGDEYLQQDNPLLSWTSVTNDPQLVIHLLHMYFFWHYPYFTALSKKIFLRDFLYGKQPPNARRKQQYCTPLLVNAILAISCHFTSHPGARSDPADSATAGDHFFREAKRLLMGDDELETPSIATVQALSIMSVREAGCGREARGWVYSGMAFRMSCDLGLHLDQNNLNPSAPIEGDDLEEDVRRVTFWGCYLFDKCWSNYMGRLPQLPTSLVTVSKYAVHDEEDDLWSLYTDSGLSRHHAQPMQTRAVALQILKLCEISNDLMLYFYNPAEVEKSKAKAEELRKLSDIQTRLESWRRELPKQMEAKEGCLPNVLVMHMFSQLLLIHLFRPFLKYTKATSPLPATVSPRKMCTQAAATISKLMRVYQRSHGLRQICNIAVYNLHSACTIHLLNLPDKNAQRDIIHGVRHLEKIAESWLCARRTLLILAGLARRWNIELPEEAAAILATIESTFGLFEGGTSPSASGGQSVGSNSSQTEENASRATPSSAAPFPSGIAETASTAMPYEHLYHGGNTSFQPNGMQTQSLGDINHAQATQYRSSGNSSTHLPNLNQTFSGTNAQPGSFNNVLGGADQLARDSQEWAYRDQAQLATAFGNWDSTMDVDSANWAIRGEGRSGSLGGVSDHADLLVYPSALPGTLYPGATAPPNPGGPDTAAWLDGMNPFPHQGDLYDENGWRQPRPYDYAS